MARKRHGEWVEAVLGLGKDWAVLKIERSSRERELRVVVGPARGAALKCPQCGRACPGYDSRRREWRHLDAWTYRTFVVCDVPRVQCPEHGIVTMQVPWADGSSRYTVDFEALAIKWLRHASVSAVSERLRISWNAAGGIKRRAVERGLERRRAEPVRRLSVDETSFRRGHRYVTVVSDPDTGRVLEVEMERTKEALARCYDRIGGECLEGVESVSMDMWAPYISTTRERVPGAATKVAFDKFHVAKHLGDAVDKVRRAEHRELLAEGNPILAGTRFDWLRGRERKSHGEKLAFARLRTSAEKTAQAWTLKEIAAGLWRYRTRSGANAGWTRWLEDARTCSLAPVAKVARMIERHLWGIVNAVVLRATNGPAEGINSRIKTVKVRSRGFRNPERFADAILFHLGGLDLMPTGGARPSR